MGAATLEKLSCKKFFKLKMHISNTTAVPLLRVPNGLEDCEINVSGLSPAAVRANTEEGIAACTAGCSWVLCVTFCDS